MVMPPKYGEGPGWWNGGRGQGTQPRNAGQRRREADQRLPLRRGLGGRAA